MLYIALMPGHADYILLRRLKRLFSCCDYQVTIINRKSRLLPIFYSSMSIFRINQRFVNGMLYMHKISSHNSFDSFQHLFEWSCILTYSFGNRQWFTTFIASFQNVKYLIKQCIKDLMYFWNDVLGKIKLHNFTNVPKNLKYKPYHMLKS
jgi:hypothetical protein